MRIHLLPDLVIEPQASGYYFVFGPPQRVGDVTLIRVPGEASFGRLWAEHRVILLKDRSGRQWLVEVV